MSGPADRTSSGERLVTVDGIELCTEAFGRPQDDAVLLVMGLAGSMLWWEEGFCRMLADRGRFVIRYDHRDTGRSVCYPVGAPGYTGDDLVDDAARVLDSYGVRDADVVGVSAGGALAQLFALDHPDRTRALVLISTSSAVPTGRDLPPPAEAYRRFTRTAGVDWADPDSVVDYLVGYSRMLAGEERAFDETGTRALVLRDIGRSRDIAAGQNHYATADGNRTRPSLSTITAPTVVIHGSADPMFPLEHGRALAEEIPTARLVTLSGAGHGVYRADWPIIVDAIARVRDRPID